MSLDHQLERPRMGRKTSMPRRSDRPGHKIGRNNLRYWIAKQVVVDPLGFPDACIPLPVREPDEAEDAWEDRISALCREHTARLEAWIDARAAGDGVPTQALRYDGSVKSACEYFENHELSPFNTSMKFNTQDTCRSTLRTIKATVGPRIVSKVTVPDTKNWYMKWRAPYTPGDREHVKRAHEAISVFRQVIYFMASMRFKDCKPLAEELQYVKFEKAQGREQEITYAQACAYIRTALEQGQKGIIPVDRGLIMAIGMAAQFEITTARQRDIIGEWAPKGAPRKLHGSMAVVDLGDEAWAGFFAWELIPGWRWRMRTSKSNFRKGGDFNLESYPLLFPLLEAVPYDQRQGAIIKGEGGLPIRQRTYGDWFRPIATAAGIPEDVWNMDSRAGGASEAFVASGGDIKLIQSLLKHTTEQMTWRYIRRSGQGAVSDRVADMRNRNRKGTS